MSKFGMPTGDSFMIAEIKALEAELDAARGEIERLKWCGNCGIYGWKCDPYGGNPKRKDASKCDEWVDPKSVKKSRKQVGE